MNFTYWPAENTKAPILSTILVEIYDTYRLLPLPSSSLLPGFRPTCRYDLIKVVTSSNNRLFEKCADGQLVLGEIAPLDDDAPRARYMLPETVTAYGGSTHVDVATPLLGIAFVRVPKNATPLLKTSLSTPLHEHGSTPLLENMSTPLREKAPLSCGSHEVLPVEKSVTTIEADMMMTAVDDIPTRMTSLHLEIPPGPQGSITHNESPRDMALLHFNEAPVTTTPSTLLTPPADATAPPRPETRDYVAREKIHLQMPPTRRGRKGRTVNPDRTTPSPDSIESEPTRKRSRVLAEATTPVTPMNVRGPSGGSGLAEHQPAMKIIRTAAESNALFNQFLAEQVRLLFDLFVLGGILTAF